VGVHDSGITATAEILYPRFFPPGRKPVRLPPLGLPLKPDFEKPPGRGLERSPEAGLFEPKPGLRGPPKLGLDFQSGPAFLSAREVELGYGFALVGR
jgi:hypothetical protein